MFGLDTEEGQTLGTDAKTGNLPVDSR